MKRPTDSIELTHQSGGLCEEDADKLGEYIYYLENKVTELIALNTEIHGWIARAMMKGCCDEDITKEVLQKFIDERDIKQQALGILEWVQEENNSRYPEGVDSTWHKYGYEVAKSNALRKAKALRKLVENNESINH